jgi:hypothetical protein
VAETTPSGFWGWLGHPQWLFGGGFGHPGYFILFLFLFYIFVFQKNKKFN